MKLGIMQPYLFPYLGYFELIFQMDQWIIFDTAQYIRHGWVNRNRILHPHQGWQYLIVPLKKHRRETPINEVKIAGTEWRQRILGQLQHYRKKAPFFQSTILLVEDCLADETDNLARLNARILGRVCSHLGIPWNSSLLSEMNLAIGPVDAPGDWALRIAVAVGAREYINPPSGAHLFDRAEFKRHGIELRIQEPFAFTYPTKDYQYESNLSIIDVLMWVSVPEIRQHLELRRNLQVAAGQSQAASCSRSRD